MTYRELRDKQRIECRDFIASALSSVNGSKRAAAKAIGVRRPNLYGLIRRYGVPA